MLIFPIKEQKHEKFILTCFKEQKVFRSCQFLFKVQCCVRFQRLSVALHPELNFQSRHTQQNKIKGKQRKPKTVDIVSEAKYEYKYPGTSSKVYFRLKLDWQQTPINNLSRCKTLKKHHKLKVSRI